MEETIGRNHEHSVISLSSNRSPSPLFFFPIPPLPSLPSPRRYFSDAELLKCASFCREVTYKAGESIAVQGDFCDAMFFIVSGLVRICRSVTDSTVERSDREDDLKLCDVVVTKLCSGEMFGESAVMPASLGTFQCTVQCETAVKCFRVDKAQLDLEMFREGGALLEEVKKASVTYPDDSILLQMFLDQKRSTAMRIKVMKEMEGTLKQRDRKKEKRR